VQSSVFGWRNPFDVRLLSLGAYFMNYPFRRSAVPRRNRRSAATFVLWGPTVILSDGDAVLQPRKVERAGLAQAVNGRHPDLSSQRGGAGRHRAALPADRYVLVDDKLQILTAAKRIWGERVTTIFPRQGALAHDAAIIASNPPRRCHCRHPGIC
jgi:hypothetical protein